MRDPLQPRIEYLIGEWRRQADEIDARWKGEDPIDLAQTLRHCADVLAEAIEHARRLR